MKRQYDLKLFISCGFSPEPEENDEVTIEILENYRFNTNPMIGWLWDAKYKRKFSEKELIKLFMDSGMLTKVKEENYAPNKR